uniref:Uncharacterized protein n=1 Tax=Arundo donax TaxID=35708 RepID=A0A0A8Y0D8_ARUDO
MVKVVVLSLLAVRSRAPSSSFFHGTLFISSHPLECMRCLFKLALVDSVGDIGE